MSVATVLKLGVWDEHKYLFFFWLPYVAIKNCLIFVIWRTYTNLEKRLVASLFENENYNLLFFVWKKLFKISTADVDLLFKQNKI